MIYDRDIWYCVNDAKSDIDLNNTKHDMKFFKWGIRVWRELNNYNLILPSGKTTKLTLDSNNSAYLPADCEGPEAIYKVGVCVNGYWVNFDLNETICMTSNAPCSCDEIESTLATGVCDSDWWNTRCHYMGFFEKGQYVGGIYGMGAGFYRGGYKVDAASRRIQFDSYVTATDVLIEYRTSGGLVEDGNAYVPEILIRPLTAFIHRERCTFESENTTDRFRANMMASQAVKFGQRYVTGVKAAVQQLKGMSVDQLLATWRASIHQLPKR